MDKKYILITGITGFLGSHIAKNLVSTYNVIGLKRKTSIVWRCEEFKNKVIWINIDEEKKFLCELNNYRIYTIIHGAWIGVESHQRNDWSIQINNIDFFLDILEVAKKVKVEKWKYMWCCIRESRLRSSKCIW